MSVLPDRFLNKKHPHSAANATSYVSRQVPLNVQKAPASTTINFRIGFEGPRGSRLEQECAARRRSMNYPSRAKHDVEAPRR